ASALSLLGPERRAQRETRPVQLALHRALRKARDRHDLVVAHPLDVAQNDEGALLIGEHEQRTLYERLGLPALDHRVGPRDVRARTTAIVEPLCLVIEGRSSVTRAPTEVLQSVAAVVRRHAVDPRAELGVAAEAVDGAKDG